MTVEGLSLIALSVLALLRAGAASAATPLPLYVYGPPAGAYAGQAPKGLVITIHGGGWYFTGESVLRGQPTLLYQEAGWATLNVDHRRGPDSIEYIVHFYDEARSWLGADVPICAAGRSS